MEKFDPINSAFYQLYYRAQEGLWAKYEHKHAGYDETKTASLQLKDESARELLRRKNQESDLELKQSESFMLKMQGYALQNH